LVERRRLRVVLAAARPGEAEGCDRVAVVQGGRIVACESPDALRRRVSGDVIVIDADDADALARALGAKLGLAARVEAPARLTLEHERGHELIPRLVEAFAPGRIRSLGLRRPSLGAAFVKLTGHLLAEDEA